jgi:hypothetical protein
MLDRAVLTCIGLTLFAPALGATPELPAPRAWRVDVAMGEYISDAFDSSSCGKSHHKCLKGLSLRAAYEAPIARWLAASLDAALQTDGSKGGLTGTLLVASDVGLIVHWPGRPPVEPRLYVLLGPIASRPGLGWAVHGGPALIVFPRERFGVAIFVDGGGGRIGGRSLATVQYGLSLSLRL